MNNIEKFLRFERDSETLRVASEVLSGISEVLSGISEVLSGISEVLRLKIMRILSARF